MNCDQAHALIANERIRQVERGWSAEHDDGHGDGSLLKVAELLFEHGVRGARELIAGRRPIPANDDAVPVGFPWNPEWWKPKTPLRDLVRAGALCVAERERRERKARRDGSEPVIAPVEQKLELIVEALCTLEVPV